MNVEKLNVNGVELDVCDRQARDAIGGVNTRVNTVEQGIVDVNARIDNIGSGSDAVTIEQVEGIVSASVDEVEGTVNGRIDSISGSVDSVGSEVDRVKKSVGYCVNLLPNNAISQSINGLDIVVNEDKSITVNGTATKETRINILGSYVDGVYHEIDGIEEGEYILKGCADGGGGNTYTLQLSLSGSGTGVKVDQGTGKTFTHIKGAKYVCSIMFKTRPTHINTTFKPMICRVEDDECDYEPYVERDRAKCSKLENDVALLQSGIGFIKKNLLEHNLTAQTINGITFTVNTDKSISVSGTATADSYIRVDLTTGTNSLYVGKKYILNGNTVDGYNGGVSSYVIASGVGFKAEDCGSGVEFEYPQVNTLFYAIFVKSGTVLSKTYKVSPMIRFADIDDGKYESYVPSIFSGVHQWSPIATSFRGERCTYVKTKDMLTIWLCLRPSNALNTSTKTCVVCEDLKSIFGIKGSYFAFNVVYALTTSPCCALLVANDNTLMVQYMNSDIGTNHDIYGQISIPIY